MMTCDMNTQSFWVDNSRVVVVFMSRVSKMTCDMSTQSITSCHYVTTHHDSRLISYVWPDSFTCERVVLSPGICGEVVAHSHVCVRHFSQANRSCHICEWVMSHTWICHIIIQEKNCSWVLAYDKNANPDPLALISASAALLRCVCVCEREREREIETETERERGCVSALALIPTSAALFRCVCVCLCVWRLVCRWVCGCVCVCACVRNFALISACTALLEFPVREKGESQGARER